jgi:23S rRNA (adenine2503-C2)-methyltransferase
MTDNIETIQVIVEKKSILDQDGLDARLKENKIPSFRKKQIYTELFTNSVIDFAEMTTLPLDLRIKLQEEFTILPFEVDSVHENPESTKI